MCRLIKQVFIALLSFSGSLATRYLSLNNEPIMTRPTLLDINSIELKYYPFMITLDKCNGSCNVVDDLSTKSCAPSESKDINVEVFNLITRINKAKTSVKHISCDCNCKFDNATCIFNQKLSNNECQWECKKYHMCKIDYGWNSSTCI